MKILFENLQNFKARINLEIFGEENYLKNNGPSIFVSNHNCLMDIFYLPAAIKFPTVSLISPRLMYKRELQSRYDMVNNLIYSMPIEAHGGTKYSDICLTKATNLLCNNISLTIFPEGAYIEPSNMIYRARTGAARILYNSITSGIVANIIPVAIQIVTDTLSLDSYDIPKYLVKIHILPAIEYDKYYRYYLGANSLKEKNVALHFLMDDVMRAIAIKLGKEYSPRYIELFPKNNVIFEDGNIVKMQDAQNEYYLSLYEQQLSRRLERILLALK